MTETKYIAYLRVSTQKQGFSGLGLEAQREIIHNYLKDTVPIAEYIEVESGRKSDRPKLKEALSQCRKENATLIVAKLDRLARSVSFLSNLFENITDLVPPVAVGWYRPFHAAAGCVSARWYRFIKLC